MNHIGCRTGEAAEAVETGRNRGLDGDIVEHRAQIVCGEKPGTQGKPVDWTIGRDERLAAATRRMPCCAGFMIVSDVHTAHL
ncbi:MAG: hypothetical protein DI555_17445 [Novosphingobium pentaromativorans]|uniref:Uncharacterized protein n=1 Tax=Novosphingobium pentaromativorans TaxID=205844 RepID=A0A2W5Q776_9SPHN|nr:MAG: hypothetical protein DI555_17445 [Novosphingobium pentaromativorans]